MHTEDVLRLIAQGETLTTEFKRRITSDDFNDRKLVEAVACMSNSRGGVLMVGVEDDGTISGCLPFHKSAGTVPARIEALIQNKTRPSIATHAEVHTVDGKDILTIEVPQATTPVCTSNGLYQYRLINVQGQPQCMAMEPSYLFSTYMSATKRDWAALPAEGATIDDIDAAELQRYRDLSGDKPLSQLDDIQLLRALGAYHDSDARLTLGALLLFGTQDAISRFIPNHEVQFQVLDGTRVKVNESYSGPLIKVFEKVTERVGDFRVEDEINFGILRIGLENVPENVSREAVANALVHRDYSELGPIRITLSDNEFTVSSPGGFPSGITLENVLTATQPRSVLLADSFRRAGLVERTGRGVQILFTAAIKSGGTEPNFFGSNDRLIIFNYPISRADKDFVVFTRAWAQSHEDLSLTELRLIRLLRSSGSMNQAELAEHLQLPVEKVRSSLVELTSSGVLAKTGAGRTSGYRLGPGFFDSVGRRSDFIRTRELSDLDITSRIDAYIREFGAITRAQLEELCGMSRQQAYRTLARLVEEGHLRMEGHRRGAKYVRNG